MESLKLGFVVHCASHPSNDLATSHPFDDFDVNVMWTLNVPENQNIIAVAHKEMIESPALRTEKVEFHSIK